MKIDLILIHKLQSSAQISSIHYSTQIEGNKLTKNEIFNLIELNVKLSGRERDQREAVGYKNALDYIKKLFSKVDHIADQDIHSIHSLVMNNSSSNQSYRTAQNVIRESSTGAIVYLPPEPHDVAPLMQQLLIWIHDNPQRLPIPIIAAIAHYQFATIHPYIDGNGRTARLLTLLILEQHNYLAQGIYSLDEYYAKNIARYYHELDIGNSHNYYFGRAESDITSWIEYFCLGMVDSLEKAKENIFHDLNKIENVLLRKLDAKQRLVLEMLFKKQDRVTSKDIEALFGIHPGSARVLCQKWVREGFLEIADPSNRSRTYRLSHQYEELIGD